MIEDIRENAQYSDFVVSDNFRSLLIYGDYDNHITNFVRYYIDHNIELLLYSLTHFMN